MMRKYGRLAAAFCLCIIFLAGCGEAKVPDIVSAPSVAIGKEGEVTVWQVGLFDKADYVLSELQAMAAQEAGQFNSASGKADAVTVDKVEALGDGSGKVVVAYRFDGWESAAAFLEEELYFGTASQAAQEGRTAGMALEGVKDGAPYSEGQLEQAADSKVVITGIKANIYCPGKVTHVSPGALVNADGSIDTSGVEGPVCILYR